MLPTIPRWASRSMKISETTPSSRSATLVSWGVLLTMRSLVMEGPFHEPSLAHPPRQAGGERLPARGAAAGRAGRPAGPMAGGAVEEWLSVHKSGIRQGHAG